MRLELYVVCCTPFNQPSPKARKVFLVFSHSPHFTRPRRHAGPSRLRIAAASITALFLGFAPDAFAAGTVPNPGNGVAPPGSGSVTKIIQWVLWGGAAV